MAHTADSGAGEVTALLDAWRDGDQAAGDRLFELLYSELRTLAHRQLRHAPAGETLPTTALVHEVYVRLAGRFRTRVADRTAFYNVAAAVMRRILVDAARKRLAAKRDFGVRIEASEPASAEIREAEETMALERALTRLGTVEPRLARLVELRYFVELTVEEAGEVMALSPRTVKREWAKARAFLAEALSEGAAP